MKRTYQSGAEKRKIADNKRKAVSSLPKVTSYFGPASVTAALTTAAAAAHSHNTVKYPYPYLLQTNLNPRLFC